MENSKIVTDTQQVAQMFIKTNYWLTKKIETILTKRHGVERISKAFFKYEYKSKTGRNCVAYKMNTDGVLLLTMGLKGERAKKIKELMLKPYTGIE